MENDNDTIGKRIKAMHDKVTTGMLSEALKGLSEETRKGIMDGAGVDLDKALKEIKDFLGKHSQRARQRADVAEARPDVARALVGAHRLIIMTEAENEKGSEHQTALLISNSSFVERAMFVLAQNVTAWFVIRLGLKMLLPSVRKKLKEQDARGIATALERREERKKEREGK
jgi:hypothetical protein